MWYFHGAFDDPIGSIQRYSLRFDAYIQFPILCWPDFVVIVVVVVVVVIAE